MTDRFENKAVSTRCIKYRKCVSSVKEINMFLEPMKLPICGILHISIKATLLKAWSAMAVSSY